MRAHWRPSLIAHTISDWPRRASPAATPGEPLRQLGWQWRHLGDRSVDRVALPLDIGPGPVGALARPRHRLRERQAVDGLTAHLALEAPGAHDVALVVELLDLPQPGDGHGARLVADAERRLARRVGAELGRARAL